MKGLLILSGLVVAVAGGAVAVRNLADEDSATAQTAALDCALRENSWRWACNMAKDPVDLEKPGPQGSETAKASEAAKPSEVAKISADPDTTGSVTPSPAAAGDTRTVRGAPGRVIVADQPAPEDAKPAAKATRATETEPLLPPDEEIVDAAAPPTPPVPGGRPVAASVAVERPPAETGAAARRLEAAAESSAAETSPAAEAKERTSPVAVAEEPKKKRNATLRSSASRQKVKKTRVVRPSVPPRTRSAERDQPRPNRSRSAETQAADIAAGRLQVIPPGYAHIVRGSDGNYYAIPITR